jgi:hypothetical protein
LKNESSGFPAGQPGTATFIFFATKILPRQSRNQISEYLSQSRKGREEKDCHFERRKKSFLDPAHSLGMTGFGLSLGDLGVLAR